MYRIAGLIRKKRDRATQSLREGTSWRYDELVDLVSEAENIQQDLDNEKRLIDEIIESEWVRPKHLARIDIFVRESPTGNSSLSSRSFPAHLCAAASLPGSQ